MAKTPKNKAGLHTFVATGGKPKDYAKNPALNKGTVPNLPAKKGSK